MKENYCIGVDFGTDSVRAIVVNIADGHIASEAISVYRRWETGLYCDSSINQFRQHPLDYTESLIHAVQSAISKTTQNVVGCIRALSIATTGSTPVAVDKNGTPLALLAGFEENPNAMFVLWKDHTAVREADEINELCYSSEGKDFTKYEGGAYSSEWFWSKILHILRTDEKVRQHYHSWVEHCDWIPALLIGNTNPTTIKRSRCAAGHKAMWHSEWGGLPPNSFLSRIDPLLAGLRDRLYSGTFTSDTPAGTISEEWATKLGLPTKVLIGVGTLDAHAGAVGGEIKPYQLVKVIGTSTCDMMTVPTEEFGERLVKGICGQVDGSIIPGMIGLEAGQSAFGDIFAWFRDLLLWPSEQFLRSSECSNEQENIAVLKKIEENLLAELTKAAVSIPIEESGIIALDWMNGRRTPYSNQFLEGALMGLTLSTSAPKIFKALVEATAFGSKKIVEQFQEEGIKIEGVIGIGGVAQKSEFVMQIVSDILNFPIRIVNSEQTCALGCAMAASVMAGFHPTFKEAQKAMGGGFHKEYHPIIENVNSYKILYNEYLELSSFVEEHINTKNKLKR